MKRSIVVFALLLGTGLPAMAAPPTAAQKDEFYSVCVGISQNTELCSCKADAAMKLTDERMMGYVIAGMKGPTSEPADIARARFGYIQESNRACGLNY